jgi:response regulator RpfG family c-di-GMP phosphodiesterase
MLDNEKVEVLAIEPVLEDRKDIANLFKSTSYKLSFVDSFKEATQFISGTIPHFVLINIDFNKKTMIKDLKGLLNIIPNETIKICLTTDLKSKSCMAINKLKISEFFPKPLKGKDIFDKVKIFKEELKSLSVIINKAVSVVVETDAQIIALSETDFIIEAGMTPQAGERMDINSPLIEETLSEKKKYIVTPKKHENLPPNIKYTTITMLGLKNEDLQSIRAKLLHWEKF